LKIMANDLSLYALNARVAAIEQNGGVSQGTISAVNVVTDDNHLFVTSIEKNAWIAKADNKLVTATINGLMSAADKSKLDGIGNGAEVNQNAFGNLKIGSTTISAANKIDTFEFVAGTNISLNADSSTKKVTISNTYSYAHPTGDGNLHVPSTSTTNSGKFLKAGSTAGSLSWATLAITDVSSLQTTLNGKASSTHSHAITEITNLQTTLDGKAASTHGHAISDVTGLQAALDSKGTGSATGTSENTPNTLVQRDGDGCFFASTVVANVVGTVIGNVSGNVTGKAATADQVAWSGITNKPTTLAGFGINSISKNDLPTDVLTHMVTFCMCYPEDYQETPRYYFFANKQIVGVCVGTKTAPTAQVTFGLYKNDVSLATFNLTAGSKIVTPAINQSIMAASYIHFKIEGASNGLDLVTIQVQVMD
jgi:hypothetical protein